MAEKMDLQELSKYLVYDKTTGHFSWSCKASRKVIAGSRAGCVAKNGYRVITLFGRQYMEHRLAWLFCTGVSPAFEIDHIDHNRSNNAIGNLRDVPHYINQQNRIACQKDNVSGFLGVSVAPSGRFRAKINVLGAVKCLGTFNTAHEAHAVYLKDKRKHHIGCVV